MTYELGYGCAPCCATGSTRSRSATVPADRRAAGAGYEALACRRGKKIATTAIARKLLTRAYHLLADAGEPR